MLLHGKIDDNLTPAPQPVRARRPSDALAPPVKSRTNGVEAAIRGSGEGEGEAATA